MEIRADRAWRRDLAEGHLILFDTDDPAHPSLLAFVHGVSDFVSLADLLDIHSPEAIAGKGATSADVTTLLGGSIPSDQPDT